MSDAARPIEERAGPRTSAYLSVLRDEFPRLLLVEKNGHMLSRLIDRALRVATFGGQSAYMTRYVTTLGHRIYVPEGFWERSDEQCYLVMRHEAVHMRQFRDLGWITMVLLYGFVFLPVGLAYGRARLEWAGYRETIRATAEVHGFEVAASAELREHVVTQFTSAAYGWMWPFRGQVERWIREELASLSGAQSSH